MSAAKDFRERYGINQPTLAVYLSVSLSHLKQVETNARELPTPALLKLSTIALYEAKEEKEIEPVPDAGTTITHHKKLDRATRKASLQLYIAQQQLEKTLKKYGQAQRLLTLCDYLLAQSSTDDLDRLWLEGQQLAAKHKLKTFGKDEQALLQWKIACLEFAISKGAELLRA